MYGDPGYRRRYGARARYYNRYGYAGAGVGSNAGPVAVSGGYGAPVDLSQLESGYNAHTASLYAGPYGLFGSKKRAEGEATPFWNTVGDILTVGAGALVGGPAGAAVGAGIVAGRKAGKTATEKRLAAEGIETKTPLNLIGNRRLLPVGQGNIGTAASQGETAMNTVGSGPVLQYDPTGQAGVVVAEDSGLPWGWIVAGLLVAAGGTYALTRKR